MPLTPTKGRLSQSPIPLGVLGALDGDPMKRLGPMRPFICVLPQIGPIVLLATDPAQLAADHGALVYLP